MDAWCRATGEPHGEILPLATVWALSQAWYGDRMDPAYRGRTAGEAVGIFARLGLTSAFWRLD